MHKMKQLGLSCRLWIGLGLVSVLPLCSLAYISTNAVNEVAAQGDADEAVRRIVLAAAFFLTGAFVVTWKFGQVLFRPVRMGIREVGEMNDRTSRLAVQIAASSESLADGASEQAASLEETSAALEEISSTIARNADHAQEASKLAKTARATADRGVDEMKEMVSAMNEIKEADDNISRIIKTIDEIAFQTNILALNAAVEAARAGEAGMGFTVVADEVRTLAQRSSQAACETAEWIEDAISKTHRGNEISERVSVSLDDIVSTSHKVDELIAEIATASKEQSRGIQQINSAVSQMDKVTQANASLSDECANASGQFRLQSESIRQELDHLIGVVECSPLSQANREKETFQQKGNGNPITEQSGDVRYQGPESVSSGSVLLSHANGERQNGGVSNGHQDLLDIPKSRSTSGSMKEDRSLKI